MTGDTSTSNCPHEKRTDLVIIQDNLTSMFNYFINQLPIPEGVSEFEHKRFLCNQRDQFISELGACIAVDRSSNRTADMRISIDRFCGQIDVYEVKPAMGQSPMLKDFSVSTTHFTVGMGYGGSGIKNTCKHTEEDGRPILGIGVMYSDIKRVLYDEKEQKMLIRYISTSEDGKETKTTRNITINGVTQVGADGFLRIALEGGFLGNSEDKDPS